jgi:hypothetical protein
MDNVVIRLIVEGNTKKAVDELENLTEEEKKVKKEFDNAKKAADNFGKEAAEAGKKANKGAKDAGLGLKSLNEQLTDLGKTIAGAFALEAIIAFGKESVIAFAEAEENGRKLEFAVKNIANGTDGALDLLLKQADELKEISIFDDDDIIAAQQALITYGLTTDQVAKLTPKIVDLASATGMDLAQATDKIIAGINGQTKGLRDVGMQFKDTGSKVENYTIILDKLNKFQGSTTEATETSMGALKRFEIFIGDLQENTGEFLKGIADGFMFMWDVAINGSEETNKALKLTEQELKLMQESMMKLGFISDLQAASEQQLAIARQTNLEQLNNLRTKYALQDINIEATVGKAQADRIKAIDAEIQRRKDLIGVTVDNTGAYERLSTAISQMVADFQDELAIKKQLDPEDIKRYKNLVAQKNAIDEQIKKLLELQEVRKKGITTEMASKIDTTTTDKFNEYRTKKEEDYLKAKGQKEKNQIDKTIEYNKKQLEENNKAIAKFEAERDEKDLLEKLQKRQAILQESLQITTQLANAYFEQQLQQIAIERDARLKMIEDEKNARIEQAGITNQKRLEYERQFELERQQVLKEAFEQEKKWKKQQAIINGALAITNILATTPDPTGIITGLRIGAAIATTAAQVAAIDAQKFEKGGWIGGKRHRDGGTLIEAETDEFVVNRKDAQANKGLLESLNKGMSEKYIYDKYVLPAILNKSLNQVNQQGLADNIANSLKYQMYDDHYLRKTFKQASMQSAEYIVSNLKYTQKPSRYV